MGSCFLTRKTYVHHVSCGKPIPIKNPSMPIIVKKVIYKPLEYIEDDDFIIRHT